MPISTALIIFTITVLSYRSATWPAKLANITKGKMKIMLASIINKNTGVSKLLANLNAIKNIAVLLDASFQPNVKTILEKVNPNTKMIFL